ncbi:MAG: MBL fold metallo-hydrolase [Nitrospirae bacterium]|nr:MBL fold metallo-hydrolase [Nitrospirota bacterium]
MKPTFHHRLINSRFEDPSLFVRMLRERRAFLFDAGRIDRLSSGDLLKITAVFVTHMHIDHFIGFDTLLRALLRRETPLRVYGPEDIINCIEGKLRGYTWNLIEEYPIKIEVFGINQRKVRHSSFYGEKSFARIDRGEKDFDGTALEDPPYTVKAVSLSHGIPCLGFSLEEAFHINIDKAGLNVMNLPVGPWLSDLKRMIRDKAAPDTPLRVDGREFKFAELIHIAAITEGQKVSYITDVSPGEDNLRRVSEFVKNSDTLYCEAYFLHEDRERAFERHHLTAKMAGDIARKAKVRNLVLMHFSPKYRDQAERIEEEAMKEYKNRDR